MLGVFWVDFIAFRDKVDLLFLLYIYILFCGFIMVQMGIIQSVVSVSSIIPSPLRNKMIGISLKQLNNTSPDVMRIHC